VNDIYTPLLGKGAWRPGSPLIAADAFARLAKASWGCLRLLQRETPTGGASRSAAYYHHLW
jgi:hypothetical protein